MGAPGNTANCVVAAASEPVDYGNPFPSVRHPTHSELLLDTATGTSRTTAEREMPRIALTYFGYEEFILVMKNWHRNCCTSSL